MREKGKGSRVPPPLQFYFDHRPLTFKKLTGSVTVSVL